MSSRLAVAFAAVVLLSACQPEPEAKYPKDLNSCELLPREVAGKVTDVGAKLGPPEEKTFNFIVTYKYCKWSYKQPQDHFWSEYQKGPVKRELTVRAEVTSKKSGGATAVAVQYGGQLDNERKQGHAVQEMPGIGEDAFLSTQEYSDQTQRSQVVFRRSNVLIWVTLHGEDCCRHPVDMQAANRRKIVLAAAKAADEELLSR